MVDGIGPPNPEWPSDFRLISSLFVYAFPNVLSCDIRAQSLFISLIALTRRLSYRKNCWRTHRIRIDRLSSCLQQA